VLEVCDQILLDEKVLGIRPQFAGLAGGGTGPLISDVQSEALRDELMGALECMIWAGTGGSVQ
jgi:hypothetical protein